VIGRRSRIASEVCGSRTVAADTLFVPDRLAGGDCVLACSRSGLARAQVRELRQGINVTLGLPMVAPRRPRHRDRACRHRRAEPDSLIEASKRQSRWPKPSADGLLAVTTRRHVPRKRFVSTFSSTGGHREHRLRNRSAQRRAHRRDRPRTRALTSRCSSGRAPPRRRARPGPESVCASLPVDRRQCTTDALRSTCDSAAPLRVVATSLTNFHSPLVHVPPRSPVHGSPLHAQHES